MFWVLSDLKSQTENFKIDEKRSLWVAIGDRCNLKFSFSLLSGKARVPDIRQSTWVHETNPCCVYLM